MTGLSFLQQRWTDGYPMLQMLRESAESLVKAKDKRKSIAPRPRPRSPLQAPSSRVSMARRAVGRKDCHKCGVEAALATAADKSKSKDTEAGGLYLCGLCASSDA